MGKESKMSSREPASVAQPEMTSGGSFHVVGSKDKMIRDEEAIDTCPRMKEVMMRQVKRALKTSLRFRR